MLFIYTTEKTLLQAKHAINAKYANNARSMGKDGNDSKGQKSCLFKDVGLYLFN